MKLRSPVKLSPVVFEYAPPPAPLAPFADPAEAPPLAPAPQHSTWVIVPAKLKLPEPGVVNVCVGMRFSKPLHQKDKTTNCAPWCAIIGRLSPSTLLCDNAAPTAVETAIEFRTGRMIVSRRV